MALIAPVALSPNGEYLAYSSPDGTLKLWETATGLLKQEYTPSSHLSATCSCISWSDLKRPHSESPKKKKKKRKSSIGDAVASLDLVALGTTSGSILLYSVIKGDLQTQLTDGHSDIVHGICWHPDGETLYSCSADQHIVEWCLSTATVKRKWAADKSSVYSLALCPTGTHLLSAGRKIKLWDLDTQEVLKTFTGHATEVMRLLPVRLSENCMMNGAGEGRSLEGSYFLSAAVNDRLINVWQVTLSSKNKNALAAFSLTDEPIYMHLDSPRQEGQPFWLIVVTKGGEVLVFEHMLNGRLKKPVKPKVTLRIATEGSSDSAARPIPVLSASFESGDERKVLVAHGNFLKPTFERVAINSADKEMCLVREDPNKTVLQTQASVSKVKTPAVSQDVTVLAPGHLAPCGPVRPEGEAKGKKRRKSNDLSMEQRLNAISISSSSAPSRQKEPPRADTLATLLTQGLQSKDKQILNNVLQHSNEALIRNTVRRLPLPVIVPLTQELTRRMYGQSRSGHTLVKWIKLVLTLHTSYLMTFPELVGTLGTLYEMMDSRVELFSRFSRLQGKLDLILSQVTSQGGDEEEAGPSSQAMLVYQDESSEEDVVEDIVPDHSESEENWEDESDMEVPADNSEEEEAAADEDDDDDDSAEASDSDSDNDNEDEMIDGD